MFAPKFTTQGTDREKLKAFLMQVEKLLADLVNTGQDSRGKNIIIEDLKPSMKAAWQGSTKDDGAPARFDEARKSVATVSEQQLQAHGLQGPMLSFKLAVLNHWADTYKRLGGWRWLDKLLDMIDALFDSLLKALKLGTALSELKEFIQGSIDEPEMR